MKKLLIATIMNIMMFTTSTFAVTDTQGVEDFVSRFYTEVLDRTPDQAGLDDWVNRLVAGESAGSDVATGFIFSQEFINRDTDNITFLNILYRAFFNREADSGGFNTWMDELNQGTSREDVLNGFLYSEEFANLCKAYGINPVPAPGVEDFVKRFYIEVLGRIADAAGLADWVNRLNTKVATGADIAYGFIFSAEFTNRNTDDVTFLEILYKAFFNRAADEGGVSAWLSLLEQGGSREDVLNGFLHSQEFINLCNIYEIIAYIGAPSANADYMSSYENSKTSIYINYYELPIQDSMLRDAIAYLDADGDGDIDVFMGTGIGLLQGEVDSVLSINDGTENFTSSTSEFSDNMPPATHARKTLVSDFNGDGLKDMFILDHGYDAEPFPGSQPKLIMQDSIGKFSWTKFPLGFNHGGAAGDIDNDGDIDIFVADHKDLSGNASTFYINDGNANFTKNETLYENTDSVVYSAELIDIDKDGFIDLLTGGHEREGHKTSIFWGNGTGKYTTSNHTIIPTVPHMGVILDFDAEDIDGDGDRDLIINRTRDGDDGGGLNFYVGRTTQLLRNNGNINFTDITSTNIDNPGGDTDQWFPWLRVQDFDGDGDMDIRPDNADLGFEYINDGTGNFTKHLL